MRASDFVNRRGARAACTALAYGALWCACARIAAQTPSVEVGDVRLSIPDCEDISGAEIAKLAALELAPRGDAPPAGAQDVFTHASVRCVSERATITVADPRRPNALVLELALAATPREARARLLALAVAELIATSRLERLDTGAAQPQPKSPQPPPAEPSQPPEPSRPNGRVSVFLEAGAARALEPARFAPAFATGVSIALAPFALISDLAYERGQMSTSDVEITAHSASLSVAPAWQLTTQRVTLALAIGLRGGYALLAGAPRRPELAGHDVSGLFLAPIAGASMQLGFAEHWAARLALEFGYVIKPVRGLDADRTALLELDGMRMTALLGLAWSP